jgi:UDP-N-acetylmuramate: L-alanyl-gamma-D-glutamyl-meso-diaminopimelate ligase
MAKTVKHIHILGLAGTMTAPLAIALQKQGYTITGSAQKKIYPPMSDLITNISINQTPINKNIDLAIIGSSFLLSSRCRDEFEQIKKLNIPHISATQYLSKHLIKPESILVAGSFGKTTITALLAHIFPQDSYFFGGQTTSQTPSLQFANTNRSIIEADESINGLDTQAKFLYYPVKYLILTSVDWEHKDCYPTAEKNLEAFRQLVKNIPPDGVLIYNQNSPEIQKLLPDCQAKTIPYSPSKKFDTKLVGYHNQENIAAAYTLCQYLGLKNEDVLKAIATFPGIKRRLEKIYTKNNILIYDDFAQSATRVKSALEALKYSYPHHHLCVYFEPHASFLKNFQSVEEFKIINGLFNDFVLGKISFSADITKESRVTVKNWQKIIGQNFQYFPMDQDIINYYSSNLKPGDILIHFSSGGLDGLNNLKTVYNLI